jgi:Sec-independent protein translocase protein TatA
MLSSIGPMELIVVLVIALIVLGPKRLPDAGRLARSRPARVQGRDRRRRRP